MVPPSWLYILLFERKFPCFTSLSGAIQDGSKSTRCEAGGFFLLSVFRAATQPALGAKTGVKNGKKSSVEKGFSSSFSESFLDQFSPVFLSRFRYQNRVKNRPRKAQIRALSGAEPF